MCMTPQILKEKYNTQDLIIDQKKEHSKLRQDNTILNWDFNSEFVNFFTNVYYIDKTV